MKKSPQTIVFSDFDGTITDKESLVSLFLELVPNETRQVMDLWAARNISLKEGVTTLVEAIDSSRMNEILDFSKTLSIRPGFEEFLDFLEKKDISFVLISGGLMPMVKVVLGSLAEKCKGIHALELDASGPKLKVVSDFISDKELMAKVQVMDLYEYDSAVAIGDGITDIYMALNSDVVFARKHLEKYLYDREKPFLRWDDFFDIQKKLEELWQ